MRPGDRLTFGNTELLFQQKGQVTADAPYTQPLVLHGNQAALHLPVPLRHVTLGTKGEVHLAGAGVLPQHAEIVAQGETLTLKARGPLRVNEQDVAAGASIGLRPGDLLKIGDTEYALIRSELKPVN